MYIYLCISIVLFLIAITRMWILSYCVHSTINLMYILVVRAFNYLKFIIIEKIIKCVVVECWFIFQFLKYISLTVSNTNTTVHAAPTFVHSTTSQQIYLNCKRNVNRLFWIVYCAISRTIHNITISS